MLSLLAHPAQGEGEGSSGGWAWRSPCLSLSLGVCNMGVTMQYPAQVLWEADTPARLIRGAPRAVLPLPESQCSGGASPSGRCGHTEVARAAQSPHPLGSSLRPRSPGETGSWLEGSAGVQRGQAGPGHPPTVGGLSRGLLAAPLPRSVPLARVPGLAVFRTQAKWLRRWERGEPCVCPGAAERMPETDLKTQKLLLWRLESEIKVPAGPSSLQKLPGDGPSRPSLLWGLPRSPWLRPPHSSRRLRPHVASSCVSVPPLLTRTPVPASGSHPTPSDLTLTTDICQGCCQVQSHAEVLGDHEFWGHTLQPTTSLIWAAWMGAPAQCEARVLRRGPRGDDQGSPKVGWSLLFQVAVSQCVYEWKELADRRWD